MACLRVVRFRTTGAGEYSELALCIPHSDSPKVTVIYGDREDVTDTSLLCKALDVHVENMLKKASVLGAVERDGPALRRKLPDYQDVRRLPSRVRGVFLVCHTLCRTLRNTARRSVRRRSLPVLTKP